MMKKTLEYLLVAAVSATCLASCAKSITTGTNDASKRYFDAWIAVNYPDLEPTELGSYVIEEIVGDGELVGDYENSPYVRVAYTQYDLDWNIEATTSEKLSQQLGDYDESYYYGPRIWTRVNDSYYAGLDEAITSMNVGGYKRTVIPGWLYTTLRYSTAEDYVNNVSASDHAIYDLIVVETIDDMVQWEIDSIANYLSHNFPEVSVSDSLIYGLYYIQTAEPADTAAFASDTTLYINYIARRLDGQVVDTNIQDTAKRYGIYSSSTTYEPTQVNWYDEDDDEDYTSITITSDESSIIDGLSYTLSLMRSYEKGTCIFYSALGYSSSGSGSTIPEYSPLRFDIEFVDGEEDD